jgi:hypothetical protein
MILECHSEKRCGARYCCPGPLCQKGGERQEGVGAGPLVGDDGPSSLGRILYWIGVWIGFEGWWPIAAVNLMVSMRHGRAGDLEDEQGFADPKILTTGGGVCVDRLSLLFWSWPRHPSLP